jgi:hypothetical protein
VAEASPHFIKALLLTFGVEPIFCAPLEKENPSTQNFRFRSAARRSFAVLRRHRELGNNAEHNDVRNAPATPETAVAANQCNTCLRRDPRCCAKII